MIGRSTKIAKRKNQRYRGKKGRGAGNKAWLSRGGKRPAADFCPRDNDIPFGEQKGTEGTGEFPPVSAIGFEDGGEGARLSSFFRTREKKTCSTDRARAHAAAVRGGAK